MTGLSRFINHVGTAFLGLIWAISIGLTLFSAASAHAQAVDSTPPVIELEELVEGVADLSQVFTVQIAEDGVLIDAILYFRRSGQQPYMSVPMTPLGDSGFFSVSIETDPEDLRPIEYYVQARDAGGNRTVSGYAFDPYIRNLAPAERVVQRSEISRQSSDEASRVPPFLQRRWVQITLGVVAVGIAASVLSSDGSEDTTVVPVQINLE